MTTTTQKAIDLVNCSKLRVIVAQLDDVDEEQIENAVATFAETLGGARWTIHAVPVDEGAQYRETVEIALETIDAATATSDDGDESEP